MRLYLNQQLGQLAVYQKREFEPWEALEKVANSPLGEEEQSQLDAIRRDNPNEMDFDDKVRRIQYDPNITPAQRKAVSAYHSQRDARATLQRMRVKQPWQAEAYRRLLPEHQQRIDDLMENFRDEPNDFVTHINQRLRAGDGDPEELDAIRAFINQQRARSALQVPTRVSDVQRATVSETISKVVNAFNDPTDSPDRLALEQMAQEYGATPKRIAEDRTRLTNAQSVQSKVATARSLTESNTGGEPPVLASREELKEIWDAYLKQRRGTIPFGITRPPEGDIPPLSLIHI